MVRRVTELLGLSYFDGPIQDGIEWLRRLERSSCQRPSFDGDSIYGIAIDVAPQVVYPDMQPIDVYEFVEFGVWIQTIRWYRPNDHNREEVRDLAAYRASQFESFRNRWLKDRNIGLDLIDLVIVTLRTAAQLDEQNDGTTGPLGIHPVDWSAELASATRYINELMTVFAHEFPKLPFFAVSPTRAFDTTILLKEAERALSESARRRLSDFWLEGWREAGRCLAFDAPTAATYQMLRVTEGFIKKYRHVVTGSEGPESDGLSEHINALKAVGSKAVIAALRALKNTHRNPTMHPGPNATPDEAVGLFGLCTSVVDFIAADMDSREQAAVLNNLKELARLVPPVE